MDTTELEIVSPATAEDRMVALAGELTSLRWEIPCNPETVDRIASGLSDISHLALECGQLRVSKACKALSSILLRMERGQEEDAGFILSTALNFIDALQAKRIRAGKVKA